MRKAGAKRSPRARWSMPPAPGSASFARPCCGIDGQPPVRLVKGSHIVVRKLFDHDRGYIFQNADRRIVFALPFAQDFTLIGTTDENFTGDLDAVAPSADEITYLCRAVNEFFRERGRRRTRWCGRLPACARSMTTAPRSAGGRDARLSSRARRARRHGAAAHGLRRQDHHLSAACRGRAGAGSRISSSCAGAGPPTTPLPGGDFLWDAIEARVAQTLRAWPFLTEAEAWRLVRAYGTRVDRVMGERQAARRHRRRSSARSARPRCAT